MLSLTPPWWTAVFLARIVIPFSRSRSIESITRSATSWPLRKAPVCHSIASTRVVLPWSTWAMIAMFRRSSRVVMLMRGRCRGSGVAGKKRGPPVAGLVKLLRAVRDYEVCWTLAAAGPLGPSSDS